MNYQFPHTIQNNHGEVLTFKEIIHEQDGDRVLVENVVAPGAGPIMHTHWLQDEALTVTKGRMGYQVYGQPARFAGEGESIEFKRGTPHRFWNDGTEELKCTGFIKPVNTIVFYLSSIYDAQKKSGSEQPEKFDGAYLLTRYASEYDLPELPKFVKHVILPITCFIGKLLGKYEHFKNAPEPVKA